MPSKSSSYDERLRRRFVVARRIAAGEFGGYALLDSVLKETLNVSLKTHQGDIKRAKIFDTFESWKPGKTGPKPGTRISKRLLRVIETLTYERANKKRNDRRLSADHHLHLGPRRGSGAARRTSDLLYVFVDRTTMTCAFLGDHKSFDDDSLEQAVLAAAPRGVRQEVPGVTRLTSSRTPAERVNMARNGIITLAEQDGRFFFSGMMATTGTTLWAGRGADQLLDILEEVDPLVDDPAFPADLMKTTGSRLPHGEWSWVLDFGDLCLGQRGVPCLQLMAAAPL